MNDSLTSNFIITLTSALSRIQEDKRNSKYIEYPVEVVEGDSAIKVSLLRYVDALNCEALLIKNTYVSPAELFTKNNLVEHICAHSFDRGIMQIAFEYSVDCDWLPSLLTHYGFSIFCIEHEQDTYKATRAVLRPCPFCWVKPEVINAHEGVTIACTYTGCATNKNLRIGPYRFGFETCIKWNTRNGNNTTRISV